MNPRVSCTLCDCVCLLMLVCVHEAYSVDWNASRACYPQIISHRGACGYVPEHSLQAYQLAIDLGTDYIEPDLVLSKDGVFIAMHDVTLDDTTDVASFAEFTNYSTTKTVEGQNLTGYFASDFTLAELKMLRLKQRLYSVGRTQLYDELLSIPTLNEIIQLAAKNYLNTTKLVGMYIELKQPQYHHALGFAMEDMFLEQLQSAGILTKGAPNNVSEVVPVVVECFDPSTLQNMSGKTDLPLVQLVDGDPTYLFSTVALSLVSGYAKGIGPPNEFFTDGVTLEDALSMMQRAHSAGLVVHPWEFRKEFIPTMFNGDFMSYISYFYCCLGMDGVFTEFPDYSREVIDTYLGNASSTCYAMCAELYVSTSTTSTTGSCSSGGGSGVSDAAVYALAAVCAVLVLALMGMSFALYQYTFRRREDRTNSRNVPLSSREEIDYSLNLSETAPINAS